MRLSNELREYVSRYLAEHLPEPSSKAERDIVHEESQRARKEYEEYMQAAAEHFVAEWCRVHPTWTGHMEPQRHASYYLYTDPESMLACREYNDDMRERCDLIDRIRQKVYAMLSIAKEVSDLDEFIDNIIKTI